MKKTKKILMIMLMLTIGVMLLTGCGNDDKSEKKSNKSNNTNNDTNTSASNSSSSSNNNSSTSNSNSSSSSSSSTNKEDDKKVPTVDKTSVDYEKDDPYYFIIDGKKYKAGDQISDLSKSGLHLNKTASEKELAKYNYLIGGGAILNDDQKTVFNITPFNGGTETVKGSETQIGGFSIDSYTLKYFPDAEVCNHITIGTDIEDVVEVFGEPTSKTDATEYRGSTYKYDVKGDYKYYYFDTDTDGKVTAIRWQDYVRK